MRQIFLIPLVLCVWSCKPKVNVTEGFDVVIYGGRLMDPASNTDAKVNIGINDGSIAAISTDSLLGATNIDARGLVVAPGFVDLHCHGMNDQSFGLMVRDGVTSGFELEVGTNDVNSWYEELTGPRYVNYGVSIGHIKVRMQVLNDAGEWLPSSTAKDNVASEDQVAEIHRLINKGLDEGALAVGFGLAYTPAATTEEFESVLKIAAERGASSHIHLRNGVEGLEEAIGAVANTGASLHVVHVNSSGGPNSAQYVSMIEKANEEGLDISTEAYPYEAGMTMIESSLFDGWENWEEERYGIHQWAETGERLTRETFGKYRQQGGGVIIHERTEEMTRAALSSPLTMIASDGFLNDGKGHPRTSGTYSKVLGKYVREQGLYTLMDALRRMTIEPARRLEQYVPAMQKKGRISVGADADITIFNPETIIDQATYTNPVLPSKGVIYVLVNGKVTVEDGNLLEDAKYGQPIRRQGN